MKGFLEEYGLIIVVVAVILLMLLFGKAGYAKGIQNAILGSADHIVETGENITTAKTKVKPSTFIDIEGKKYIVLEKKGTDKYLVMTASSIGDKAFQSTYSIVYPSFLRPDGQNANTYEGSDIDNYLENEWYNGLSAKTQSAIQTTDIKQASYTGYDDPDSKQETGPDNQVYNTISRHVFLPSVSEIGNVVDLKNKSKVNRFLKYTSTWTKDSFQGDSSHVKYLMINYGVLDCQTMSSPTGTRPTFVIDLSKVDYTEGEHVDYK